MIRAFLLRVLSALASLITRAQAALEAKVIEIQTGIQAELDLAANELEIEITHEGGAAIAAGIIAERGAIVVVEKSVAQALIDKGAARRV
jgi:hypothetical protein